MEIAEITIFLAAWIIGVISWLLAVAEFVAANRFAPWAYSIGFTIFKESANLPKILSITDKIVELDGVKLKIVSENKIFFIRKNAFFELKIRTPFPIRGIIVKNNNKWQYEAVIPLFTVIFLAAWLIGWSASGISAFARGDYKEITIITSGWIFVTFMALFSLNLEKKRAKAIKEKIENYLLFS